MIMFTAGLNAIGALYCATQGRMILAIIQLILGSWCLYTGLKNE